MEYFFLQLQIGVSKHRIILIWYINKYINNTQAIHSSSVDITSINDTKPLKSYRIYHVKDACLNVMVHFYHRSRRHTKKIQQNRNRRKSEIGWNIKVKVCNFFYHLVVTTIHLFCKYATTASKSVQSSTIRCFNSQCPMSL